ncbi:MAG: hypothetical protein CVU16_13240 [Betaproteobacteria bacterium HGW-Betaproteobacteria-10]|nr:MAG: hypothetical protein CVU16_13240 [Betaproteobacteria bacterium HGW-Betaproteobacteria-10]
MAIDKQDAFVKVGVDDVVVGKPLAHPFYDGNRKLLLQRGYVIDSISQCEALIERGMYRNLHERPALAESSVARGAPVSRETVTSIEASKIHIGSVLIMQSSAEAPRLPVKLIGYLKNRGLIVTLPESGGELVMLKEGQSFIIRFFSGQHAYAFTSVVAKQTSVPFPHLHLSYPREVRGLEIRKDSRIDVELIAAVLLTDGDVEHSGAGKIVNLSRGGCALRAKTRLGKKGETINVKFKISVHDMQSYVAFDSIIRTIDDDPVDPNMPYLHGIQFVNQEQNSSLALAAFVYQKIAGDLH